MKNERPKTPQTAGQSLFHKFAEISFGANHRRILCPGQKSGQAVSPLSQDQGSQVRRAASGRSESQKSVCKRRAMSAQDGAPPAPFGQPDVRTADLDFDKRMDVAVRVRRTTRIEPGLAGMR